MLVWELPSGSAVRALHVHCSGQGFHQPVQELGLCMPHDVTEEKNVSIH